MEVKGTESWASPGAAAEEVHEAAAQQEGQRVEKVCFNAEMLHILSLVRILSTFKSFTPSFYDAIVDRTTKLQHSAWLQGRQVLKKKDVT